MTWTESDDDIPAGTIGEVMAVSGEDVYMEVEFGGATCDFHGVYLTSTIFY